MRDTLVFSRMCGCAVNLHLSSCSCGRDKVHELSSKHSQFNLESFLYHLILTNQHCNCIVQKKFAWICVSEGNGCDFRPIVISYVVCACPCGWIIGRMGVAWYRYFSPLKQDGSMAL